jgi:hypothetical protein
MRHNILYDLKQDVRACGREPIAELHRVIDLTDGESIFRLKTERARVMPSLILSLPKLLTFRLDDATMVFMTSVVIMTVNVSPAELL